MTLFRALALALLLSACASDYEFEQTRFAGSTGTVAAPSGEWAKWHYTCAAWLMRVDAPGPVPEVRWVDRRWLNYYGKLASGAYIPGSNVIYVVRRRISTEVIVHEMVHALQFQLGDPLRGSAEREAYKVGRRWNDCR